MTQTRQPLEQKPVTLPASERRDDTNDRHAERKRELRARGLPSAGCESGRIDAGWNRFDTRRLESVVAHQLLAQRLAGRDHPRARGAIEPTGCGIAWNGNRDVTRANEHGR